MTRYTIIFHPEAEQDIRASLAWGVRVWGRTPAHKWLRQLRDTIKKRLTQSPEGCPLAPESSDLGVVIRQLVIGRYRVLFTVDAQTVTILHLRGAYTDVVADETDEDE
jgi:plasmid stabilization system protein ParE